MNAWIPFMRTLTLISFLTLFMPSSILQAQMDGWGVGLILGEPTGISTKIWLDDQSAIDGALAWSFDDDGFLHLHADYLRHNFSIANVNSGQLPLYFGVGPKIVLKEDAELGVRVPFGAAYHFEGAPLDLFIEAVPILDLAPSTDLDFNIGLGARFYIE